jgi:FlaA1/EpsC-like NDP-sugar epimerase
MAMSVLSSKASLAPLQVRAPNRKGIPSVEKFVFSITFALLDLTVVMGTGLLIFCLRFWSSKDLWWQEPYLPFHSELFLVLALLIVLTGSHYGLYELIDRRPALDEGLAILRTNGLASILLVLALYFGKTRHASRLLIILTAAAGLFLQIGIRVLKRRLMRTKIISGYGSQNILIMGASESGYVLAKYLESNPQLGYRVCGFLDDDPGGEIPVLGATADLSRIASVNRIDQIIFPPPSMPRVPPQIVSAANELGMQVKVVPEFCDNLASRAKLEQLGDFSIISLD